MEKSASNTIWPGKGAKRRARLRENEYVS